MATNKKDIFKSNLSSKKKKKPSDDKIEAIADELSAGGKSKVKGFHIKFPVEDYNKLAQVSQKTHIPMKFLIIEALNHYYDEKGY